MRSALLRGAALAAAVGMWSCGGGDYSGTPTAPTPTSPAPTPAPASPTVTINIVGSDGSRAYQPNPVTANTGDTLVFKNNDVTTHHPVMDDGSADLGEIAPGASRSATLRGAGSNFHCAIHPTMVGSVNGTVPPPPPDCIPPYCDGY